MWNTMLLLLIFAGLAGFTMAQAPPPDCFNTSRCRAWNGHCKWDFPGQVDCPQGAFIIGLCEPPNRCRCCVAWRDICERMPCPRNWRCVPGPRGPDGDSNSRRCLPPPRPTSSPACRQTNRCSAWNGECKWDFPQRRDCPRGAFIIGLCEPPARCRCCVSWRDICQRQPCRPGYRCVPGPGTKGDSNGRSCVPISPTRQTRPSSPPTRETRPNDVTRPTRPPHPCVPNPCQNGGTCVTEPSGGRLCRCLPGLTGTNCEIETCNNLPDFCVHSPCPGNANCVQDCRNTTCNTCPITRVARQIRRVVRRDTRTARLRIIGIEWSCSRTITIYSDGCIETTSEYQLTITVRDN